MSVSYEQARQTVRDAVQPTWSWGTFCLDDRTIVENDESYIFQVGAREYLIDDDFQYALAGSVPVVDKVTGKLTWLASVTVALDPGIRTRANPDPQLLS